jgi:hypothetical protein
MPDTVKFVVFIALVAGVIYGVAYALASFPPQQTEITRPLEHAKLRGK